MDHCVHLLQQPLPQKSATHTPHTFTPPESAFHMAHQILAKLCSAHVLTSLSPKQGTKFLTISLSSSACGNYSASNFKPQPHCDILLQIHELAAYPKQNVRL
uniref:Uncharacterized protein n=1 Tax=Sphaerodactylus townsendi TaxID=933632 RepID=A0ACB8EI11_9SAUR